MVHGACGGECSGEHRGRGAHGEQARALKADVSGVSNLGIAGALKPPKLGISTLGISKAGDDGASSTLVGSALFTALTSACAFLSASASFALSCALALAISSFFLVSSLARAASSFSAALIAAC